MRFSRLIVAVATVAFVTTSARAAVITVGTHNLAGNQANQTVNILITGTEQVAGLTFYVQVGDGGAENGGTDTAPKLQLVNITGPGTLFGPNNVGPTDIPLNDLIKQANTVTSSGTVTIGTNSLLATLTVDTTGILNGGTFALRVFGVAPNSGGPFDTVISLANSNAITLTSGDDGGAGSLIVAAVPEPASLTLLALSMPAILRRRR